MRRIFGVISSFILTMSAIYGMLPETGMIKVKIINLISKYAYIENIIYFIIIIFSIFTVVALIYDLIKEDKKHKLKYQSKRYFDFFSKWYSKAGKLTLICDDIKWTTSIKDNRIYEALKTKSREKDLNLILKKEAMIEDSNNFNLVKELVKLGAKVYYAPTSLVGTFSFSSLSNMENNSIVIARKKTDDKDDKVIFRDINNIYVTELLNSLIDTLKKEDLDVFEQFK